MANAKHLELLGQGVKAWNAWRAKWRVDPERLKWRLASTDPWEADLSGADLSEADLSGADLSVVNLSFANLRNARLTDANLNCADLSGADLSHADLNWAKLTGASLMKANLMDATLSRADLYYANLSGANLRQAWLTSAQFHGADLSESDLSGANLSGTNLVEANLSGAELTGCRIYGVSAWRLKLSKDTKQQNLVITDEGEPEVTTDDIEVAQFLYMMLHNEKIGHAIDTIGKKGVLLLGRFTGGRIAVLERLREELRKRDFVPIVFNFDKLETKDFTETVRVLAGFSRFVIVDITNPRSAPLELQATVPEYMIPFVPILERGEEPFAMFRDLWIKHREWVLDPIRYPSVDRLIEVLDTEIIRPAQAKFAELLARKAQELRIKDI